MNLYEILYKEEFGREDIISLLQIEDEADLRLIYKRADEVRREFCGDEVHLRGIIEFSNFCEQNCVYCGLRKSNDDLPRYRMGFDEIIKCAETINKLGVQTVVLQSGEDFFYDCAYIEKIIRSIKNATGAAITLSLGERDFTEYERWKSAGADRYLLKHETANEILYSSYHPGERLNDRLDHLRYLKSLGFQTGSGNLIGMPHQELGDIADDILLCKDLEADMVSFSPFIPSPGTPYKNMAGCGVDLALKTLAVSRIVLKDVHIPATTALANIDDEGQAKGLRAGANVIMPNFTPHVYKEKYLIYPHTKRLSDDSAVQYNKVKLMVESQGRKISESKGHSLKRKSQFFAE